MEILYTAPKHDATARIRRSAALPEIWPDRPRRQPKIIPINAEGRALEVHYWRSRWSPFEVGGGAVKTRDTVAEIVSEGEAVGGFQLCDFRAHVFTSSAMFLEALDSGSAATFAVGEIICAHWEYVEDVTGYGDILELHRAWVAPGRSRPGDLTSAIRSAVTKLHPARSLMILKAFPLEYEGNLTEANAKAFKRRQAALMRYYRSSLGMHPFPNVTGEAGWMYSIPDRLRHVQGLTPSPLRARFG